MRQILAALALVVAGVVDAEAAQRTLIDFHSPAGICASLADAANFEDAERNKVFSMGAEAIRETFNKCMATVSPGSSIEPIPTYDSAKTCSSAAASGQDLSDCLEEEKKDKIAASLLWKSVDAYTRAECVLILQPTATPYMLLAGCLKGGF